MDYLTEKFPGESIVNGFNDQFLTIGSYQEEERQEYDTFGYKQEDIDLESIKRNPVDGEINGDTEQFQDQAQVQVQGQEIDKAFASISDSMNGPQGTQNFNEDLPVDDFFLQNVSFTMPGAFKNDNMDLDESPPFTIELDIYYDMNFEVANGINRGNITDVKQLPNQVGRSQNSMENVRNSVNLGSRSRSNTAEMNILNGRSRSNTGDLSNGRSRSYTKGNVNYVARQGRGVGATGRSPGNTTNGRSPGLSPGNTNNLFISRETPTQSDPSFSPFETLPRVPSYTNQQALGSHNSSNSNSNSNLFTSYQGMNELRKSSIDSYYGNGKQPMRDPNSKPNNYANFNNELNVNLNNELNNSNNTMNTNINNNPQNYNIDNMNEIDNITNYNNLADNINNNSINENGQTLPNFANTNYLNTSLYNELSPLTTTTSLTHSASSIHSTQPSFFSAHQYLTRNSLDQPPSSLHRPSFDMYSKSRPSIDSLSSQQRNSSGRYTSFTNSISNMLPFMNQRSPISGPPSPQPVPKAPFKSSSITKSPAQPQSRHLIRSIFKSSLNSELFDPEVDFGETETDPDFMIMSPTKEEPEFESAESVPMKKPKKTRRSLFTRFKTPVKIEGDEKEEDKDMFVEEGLPDSESLDNTMAANVSLQVSSRSRSPSGATSGGVSIGGTSAPISGSGSFNGSSNGPNASENLATSSLNNSHNNLQEPDYAALFENVGKRKIVNTSSYRKSKTKVKVEGDEKSSLLNLNLKSKVKLEPNERMISERLNGYNERSNSRSSASTERSRFSTEKSKFSTERSSNYSGNSSNYNYAERSNLNDSARNLDVSSDHNSDEASNFSESSSSSYHLSKTSHDYENGSGSPSISAFSAASKRILGSKISNRNQSPPSIPVATMISKGVEVEVDLKSLDLPADTKIFPTNVINSKNRTRGRKENKQADLVDLTKIYLCNYCSRRFKRQEHLKRHFRSLHTFEKPYDCLICHKKFSRSDNLNQHMKIHKEEEAAANAARNEGFVSRLEEDEEMEY
jgi:hypothetical protein